jgi:hypothetical protein
MIEDVATATGKIVQDECFELHEACCTAECPCFVLGRLPPRASLHICGAHMNRAKRGRGLVHGEGDDCKLQCPTAASACSNAESHLCCKPMPVEAEYQGTCRGQVQDVTLVHQRPAPFLMTRRALAASKSTIRSADWSPPGLQWTKGMDLCNEGTRVRTRSRRQTAEGALKYCGFFKTDLLPLISPSLALLSPSFFSISQRLTFS